LRKNELTLFFKFYFRIRDLEPLAPSSLNIINHKYLHLTDIEYQGKDENDNQFRHPAEAVCASGRTSCINSMVDRTAASSPVRVALTNLVGQYSVK
jgi:hypothetical protein